MFALLLILIAAPVAFGFLHRVVPCAHCGGIVKPDVVFFGEAVSPRRVEHCRELVRAADSVLVLGSSLTVMSGLRFVRGRAVREAGADHQPGRDPRRPARRRTSRPSAGRGAHHAGRRAGHLPRRRDETRGLSRGTTVSVPPAKDVRDACATATCSARRDAPGSAVAEPRRSPRDPWAVCPWP